MIYTIEQLKAMDAGDIAQCSPRHIMSVLQDLIATAISLQPEGFKLVPEIPTEDMLKNAGKVKLFDDYGGKSDIGRDIAADVYREMLANSPELP